MIRCRARRSGFPWASVRPDRMRDTAHVYGQLAPLGQLKAAGLDVDVASASPSAREGGSPWAGMSGAAVIADNYLVGVITVIRPATPACGRWSPPAGCWPTRVSGRGWPPMGCGPRRRQPMRVVSAAAGYAAVSLGPAYRPVSRRFRPALPTLLRPEHGLVPFLGRQPLLDRIAAGAGTPISRCCW